MLVDISWLAPGLWRACLLPRQAERSGLLDEIIVTAQKRAESLPDVPIAIAAFDSEMLRGAGDLARSEPGLAGA